MPVLGFRNTLLFMAGAVSLNIPIAILFNPDVTYEPEPEPTEEKPPPKSLNVKIKSK